MSWRDRADGVVKHQVVRFLVLGGLAAAVNWLVRFPLSLFMPLGAAVLLAYVVGMATGFVLYRNYVFQQSTSSLRRQASTFLLVNGVTASVVVGLSYLLLALQSSAAYPITVKEGVAHGLAICAGAILNYLGHQALTFWRATPTPRSYRCELNSHR